MLLPPIAYLDFAVRWFGQVSYDLATSGTATVSARDIGPSVAQDDLVARERFRAAIGARYGLPESQVVPCLGGSGAVFVIVAATSLRGGRVLVEAPGYEPLLRVPEGLGLGVDRFERSASAGFALESERVLAALRPETRLVTITNPHNPSGVLVDDRAISELAARLRARGAWLFVDEVYLELARPRATARKLGDNVVTCSSATKCWGVSWARAGWALVPESLAGDLQQVERHIAGHAPPSAWAWGERAFEHADELGRRATRDLDHKRTLVDRFVADHAGALEWTPPHAHSLFGWIRDRRGVCSLERIEQGARERGVIVSPGEFFEAPGWFRLSWTAELEVVIEGLARLGSVLELGSKR